MFSSSVSTSLFSRSWNSAHRGPLNKSKKKNSDSLTNKHKNSVRNILPLLHGENEKVTLLHRLIQTLKHATGNCSTSASLFNYTNMLNSAENKKIMNHSRLNNNTELVNWKLKTSTEFLSNQHNCHVHDVAQSHITDIYWLQSVMRMPCNCHHHASASLSSGVINSSLLCHQLTDLLQCLDSSHISWRASSSGCLTST